MIFGSETKFATSIEVGVGLPLDPPVGGVRLPLRGDRKPRERLHRHPEAGDSGAQADLAETREEAGFHVRRIAMQGIYAGSLW